MKNKIKKSKDKIIFSIKRVTSKPKSSQEHNLSEEVKAFRVTAPKMNVGDSFQCDSLTRHRVQNFLRYRNIGSNFKSRTISKKNDIIAMYCIKRTPKHLLI